MTFSSLDENSKGDSNSS